MNLTPAQAIEFLAEFSDKELELQIKQLDSMGKAQAVSMPQGQAYSALIQPGQTLPSGVNAFDVFAFFFSSIMDTAKGFLGELDGNQDAQMGLAHMISLYAKAPFYFVRWPDMAAIYGDKKQALSITEAVNVPALIRELVKLGTADENPV